jgi:hypothetical protein
MGKRSLRRLLRGRAGRAWSQTTGERKKALTIDPDFTHFLTHPPYNKCFLFLCIFEQEPDQGRSDDACDEGAADERLVHQEATRGGEQLAQQAE